VNKNPLKGAIVSITGKTLAVLIGSDPHSLLTTRQAQVIVNFEGFEGDKHTGFTRLADGRTPYYPRRTPIRNDRQVSIVSCEELERVAAALDLPEIQPEWLGANLLLQGIPRLSLLPPGSRLIFSEGVVLIVEHENQPCSGPGKVLQSHFNRPGLESLFPKAALHKRGLVACVEKPGQIRTGEEIGLDIFSQEPYSTDPTSL
jgi:hypothetical protein